jgi:AcrR family transcriptional regulator
MVPTATASTPGTPRRSRMSKEARRDQLLDIAIELFTERGYDGASMDELARRAGISKPIVYDHFGSKDGVFRACVERTTRALTRRIEEATVRATAPQERLRAGSLAFFQFISERPGWSTMLEPHTHPGAMFEEHAARVRRRQSDFMATMIAVGAREVGADVDRERVDAVAHTLIGAYEALATWWRAHPTHSPAEITDWFVALVWPGLVAVLDWPTG